MTKRKLSPEQKIQEDEYSFPYHYLSTLSPLIDVEYSSYLAIVSSYLRNKDVRVLDFGCGDGRLGYELRNSKCSVIGIDFSEKAIAFAKAFSHGVKNVSFDVQDILTYNPKKRFDVIVAMEVMEHIPKEECDKIVSSFARLLSRGGKLIVTVPSTNLSLSPKHYRHFDEKSLREMLSAHFEVTQISGHYALGFHQKIFRGLNVFGRMIEPALKRTYFMERYLRFLKGYYVKYIERSSLGKAKRLIAIANKIN